MNSGPWVTTSKFHFWSKEVIDFGCTGDYVMTSMIEFRYICVTSAVNFEISPPNYLIGTESQKNIFCGVFLSGWEFAPVTAISRCLPLPGLMLLPSTKILIFKKRCYYFQNNVGEAAEDHQSTAPRRDVERASGATAARPSLTSQRVCVLFSLPATRNNKHGVLFGIQLGTDVLHSVTDAGKFITLCSIIRCDVFLNIADHVQMLFLVRTDS